MNYKNTYQTYGHPNKIALSRHEAAAALSISPITLDRLRKRDLIRASAATRRPTYAVEELKRFMAETSKGVTP